MTNAKKELLDILGTATIKCAEIYAEYGAPPVLLKCGHSESELAEFFGKLDFNYEDDYDLYKFAHSLIWLQDGRWFERRDVQDGMTDWVICSTPEVPEYLK